jgi:protein-S-isoprenylcysteine O-methyltransferase Ste14
MSTPSLSKTQITRMVLARYFGALLLLAAMFFIPAGTLAYWEAWLFLAILFIPMAFVMLYLIKNDPALLERRMRMREQQSTQKSLIGVSIAYLLVVFLLPGLDQRFGWSDVPVWVVLLSALLVLLGYGMIIWVFRTNSYAARVVEVAEGQQVIDRGPYAIVRHPMYVGTILTYCFAPLVLDSWYAAILGLAIIPILVVRIGNEEKVLGQELKGYAAYRQKVRYRLVPGVW